MNLAPIILFVYNRPFHTELTLQALMKSELADKSILYIFCDGPKKECENEDFEKIRQVRSIIRKENWCMEVIIVESDYNKGLADSIVSGVAQVLNSFGKVIVLEDDIVVSKYFLKYMNDALNIYQNDLEVMHISAYVSEIGEGLPDTFFYNQTSCWGWATWTDKWSKFSLDSEHLLNQIIDREQVSEFDIDGSYPFSSHLRMNITGELNTWAVKWHASVFLNNGLSLHPAKSLVKNIGNDGSGIHSSSSTIYDTKLEDYQIKIVRIDKMEENKFARRKMVEFNYSRNMSSLPISPLTKNTNVKLKKEISSEDIISQYENSFSIDVRKYFEGIPYVRVYDCVETSYSFFYPDCIAGDGKFYESLEKFDWYYMPWKWEHEKTIQNLKPGMNVLEVGCAEGSFLYKLHNEHEIKCTGLELNLEAVFVAKNKGLDVYSETIQDHSKKYQDVYDVVCSFQVLEHISKVYSFIEAMLKVLKKGGKLVIGVPNNDSFLGLSQNTLNIPPHHMGLWNMKSLNSLTDIFPMKLSNFYFEPLQDYHKDYYNNTIYYALRQKLEANAKKYGFFGKLYNKLESRRFHTNLKKQFPTLENFTIIAEFVKV